MRCSAPSRLTGWMPDTSRVAARGPNTRTSRSHRQWPPRRGSVKWSASGRQALDRDAVAHTATHRGCWPGREPLPGAEPVRARAALLAQGELRAAAASVRSVRALAQVLGVPDDGRSRAALRRMLREAGVDVSHFSHTRIAIPEADLREAVARSVSYAGVVRELGLQVNESNRMKVDRRAVRFGLDTGPSVGVRRARRGPPPPGGSPRRSSASGRTACPASVTSGCAGRWRRPECRTSATAAPTQASGKGRR